MSGPRGLAPNDTEAGSKGAGLRVPFAARGPLVKLLVAKAALDLLFVAALALGNGYATPARARFDGAIDYADADAVRGWVADTREPGRPVEVQLFLNNEFVAGAVADKSPGETVGDGRLSFVFKHERPKYGERNASVYAVEPNEGGTRRRLQLVGTPVFYAGK